MAEAGSNQADTSFYFSRPISYVAWMASLLLRLKGLSPLGPIFGKELRVTARLKRTYVLRSLYLAALLVVLLFFFFIATEQYGRADGIARKAQRLSELGMWFFGVFAFFTLAAMGLVGPVLTATAINSERLHKTLPVLLMTPITAWQIVSGKLFSRLLIAFTLIGLSLPSLAVVRLLGGVEFEQILACLGLCASVAIFTAAVGLLLSTLMNGAYAVILLSYAFMGVIYALVPLVIVLFMEATSTRGPGSIQFFYNFMGLTNPAFVTALMVAPGAPKVRFGWDACALLHLGAAAGMLLLSAFILRRSARRADEGGTNTALAPLAPAASATGEAPVPLPDARVPMADTRPRRESSPRTVSDNPILWRELRRPLTNRAWQAVALASGVMLILLLIYSLMAADNGLTDRDAQVGFAVIFCGLLTVLTCIISATAIAQEKESDTWTVLLATPLSARRIVLAKAAGLLRRLLWPSVLIAVHFMLFTVGGVIDLATLWVILWLIFTTNFLWLATGLYFSLRLKTVTFAVIMNLLLPVLLYLGGLVGFGITGELVGDHNAMEIVGVYSPYGLMPPAITDLNRGDRNPSYAYNYYVANPAAARQIWIPFLHQESVSTYLQLVFAAGLIYLLVGGLILARTVYRFDAIVGRARQQAPLPGALGLLA